MGCCSRHSATLEGRLPKEGTGVRGLGEGKERRKEAKVAWLGDVQVSESSGNGRDRSTVDLGACARYLECDVWDEAGS